MQHVNHPRDPTEKGNIMSPCRSREHHLLFYFIRWRRANTCKASRMLLRWETKLTSLHTHMHEREQFTKKKKKKKKPKVSPHIHRTRGALFVPFAGEGKKSKKRVSHSHSLTHSLSPKFWPYKTLIYLSFFLSFSLSLSLSLSSTIMVQLNAITIDGHIRDIHDIQE